MSHQPSENENVLARIRNPVVDAWNDAPEDRSAASVPKPTSPSFLPPLPASPLPASPLPLPALVAAMSSSGAPTQAKPAPRLTDTPPRAQMTPRAATASAPAQAAVATAPPATVFPLVAPVLTVLAAYAVLSGFFDLMGSSVPGVVSNPNWRFGAVGAAAPTLVKPVFGAALATIALIASQRRLLSQLFMWTLLLIALGVLGVVPLFILDGLQVRPGLPSSMSGRVLFVNVAFALSFLVSGVLVLVTCAWSLRRAVRSWTTNENEAVQAWDR